VVTAGGDEKAFPGHDVLTTHVRLTHQRKPRTERRMGERRGADARLGLGV
jgi:hypothetical protein